MPAIRVIQKGKPVFQQLSFRQQDMVRLATVGVASILERTRLGRGPTDGPAKPLSQSYARFKLRRGLIPRRDLRGTGMFPVKARGRGAKLKKAVTRFVGHMMDNLSVRTVSDNIATAGFTTLAARTKAQANNQREPFLVWSPKNRAAVMEAARQIFRAATDKLLRKSA